MRIVIDLQGAQSSSSARRGIGRYSSSLALAMARASRSHEIVLALNGAFPDLADELTNLFDGLVDASNIRRWSPPPFSRGQSQAARRASERLFEAFVSSLEPDVTHVSSLFEGWDDAAAPSVGNFVPQTTAVTLYDLIPFINGDRYLARPEISAWYLHKLESLKRSDQLLSISESSRREAIDYLHFSEDRIVNVSTAANDHFKPIQITSDRRESLLVQHGLKMPFVMYTGGIDIRKNIDGLIKAYARLPAFLRAERQLAIVCAAGEDDKQALRTLARHEGLREGELILTGYVSEDDLLAFYNLCEVFVFPSWHEGFGLPALEAMQCGAAVIGANSSSVPEVIGLKDALFDPREPAAITQKLAQVLTDPNFKETLRRHGVIQARHFSWEASAEKALDALEALNARSGARVACDVIKPALVDRSPYRPRLAFLSPLPPERSGIADYSAELLPALAKHYRIDLITPEGCLGDQGLAAAFPVRSVQWFVAHAGEFDRVLYHMGNSELHAHMFDLIERFPGVVVLHDFYLSGSLAHMELHQKMGPVWRKALYTSHGYSATAVRDRSNSLIDVIYDYPCSLGVLQHAAKVIVHSTHSIDLARKWYGEPIVGKMHQVAFPKTAVPHRTLAKKLAARQSLGLAEDDLIVCAFGIVNPTKLNQRLVDCWKDSRLANQANGKLILVGQNDPGEYGANLSASIATFRMGGIQITGWVDPRRYRSYLEAADFAVQLRTRSRGETSAAVLDAMGHGLPTIVNAHGSMASLDAACVWMLPDEFTDAELIEALNTLGLDVSHRTALGDRALHQVKNFHSPDACALAYATAIEASVPSADSPEKRRTALVHWLRERDPLPTTQVGFAELADQAQAISATLPLNTHSPRLFIDVSGLQHERPNDPKLQPLRELIEFSSSNHRIELAFWCEASSSYRLARHFGLRLLGVSDVGFLDDAKIEFVRGDILTVLSPAAQTPAQDTLLDVALAGGLRIKRVSAHRFASYALDAFGIVVSGELTSALQPSSSRQLDELPEKALAAAGLPPFAAPDFNHLLHHLRGRELAQLPKEVSCFVSVGCAGTWYFEWINSACAPKRHVGIEFYSSKPDDLPTNAEWIANSAGDMSEVSDAVADVLFSGQNLEHLWPHDIIAFLRESHRVVKSSGLLVIDSPNRRVTSSLGWSHPEHILELTPDEITALVQAAGFDVTAVRGHWSCFDPDTADLLPLAEFRIAGAVSVKHRIERGRSSPDLSFSWWLEARRSARTPDWTEVSRLVGRYFAIGWPDRVNRATYHAVIDQCAPRANWITVKGSAGLVVSGPAMPLPRGRFTVAFELRWEVGDLPDSDLPLFALDVISGNGSQLAARIVSGAQLLADVSAASISFKLDDTSFGLKFRLMALSAYVVQIRRGVQLTSHDDPTFSVMFCDEESASRVG